MFFKESYKNIFIVLKMVLTLPYVKHIKTLYNHEQHKKAALNGADVRFSGKPKSLRKAKRRDAGAATQNHSANTGSSQKHLLVGGGTHLVETVQQRRRETAVSR